jgi:sialate O-acetylesterase
VKKQLSAFLVVILSFLSLGEVTAAKGGGAGFTVSPYFTSHMVLQRDRAVPVWGTAAAGTPVTVAFNAQEVTAVTSSNGKWMIKLDAMPASGQPETMVVSAGKSSVSFTDVLIGDVWILSGQSNMNYLLVNCDGGANAVESSDDFPEIRLYMTWVSGNGTTRTWLPSNSTNTPYWSGVGFFFARAMVRANGVPVGLIQVAKNGTAIASWTTYGGGNNGKLYKDNVMPIQPYAVRGVIWYQGEDDGSQLSTATQYYHMLPGLIANWRSDWGQGDFPFLYVQLAPIQGRPYWANVRDAQVCTLTTPNTAMACIIDVPTIPATAMHPTNKQPVGERLALAARAWVV